MAVQTASIDALPHRGSKDSNTLKILHRTIRPLRAPFKVGAVSRGAKQAVAWPMELQG
jgi:hypothetical protein